MVPGGRDEGEGLPRDRILARGEAALLEKQSETNLIYQNLGNHIEFLIKNMFYEMLDGIYIGTIM